MAEYKFTKDIAGSNNGYDVVEYKKGQIVAEADLCEALLQAWKKAQILIPVGEEVKEKEETTTETTETETEAETEGEGEGEAGEEEKPAEETETATANAGTDELTEEKIGELVYQAKEILEVPEGASLADEDIAKLKEIGVELKIAGMLTSSKPQTILDKINDYIDKYENVEGTEGEAGEEEIPE